MTQTSHAEPPANEFGCRLLVAAGTGPAACSCYMLGLCCCSCSAQKVQQHPNSHKLGSWLQAAAALAYSCSGHAPACTLASSAAPSATAAAAGAVCERPVCSDPHSSAGGSSAAAADATAYIASPTRDASIPTLLSFKTMAEDCTGFSADCCQGLLHVHRREVGCPGHATS